VNLLKAFLFMAATSAFTQSWSHYNLWEFRFPCWKAISIRTTDF